MSWGRCYRLWRRARLQVPRRRPRDVDYRTKTFSCSRCGADAAVCVVEPIKEAGMEDYRLDEIDWSQHHPAEVVRPAHRPLLGWPPRHDGLWAILGAFSTR